MKNSRGFLIAVAVILAVALVLFAAHTGLASTAQSNEEAAFSQMLELMMSNPRQLISSERFLERLWGYDSEADVSVVWVYISYLRKKLAMLQANVQIKATRNAGYCLEEQK